jgi:2,3-bisphosphoglycerate-independent phosphoglycerate mutase
VSYRCLLRLSGNEFNADVKCEKPDDHPNGVVANLLPQSSGSFQLPKKNDNSFQLPSEDPGSRMLPLLSHTADTLRDLIRDASKILDGRAANGIWPWSGGRAGALRTLAQRYGIRSAVISAVDVINGLGRGLGMDVIKVQGATGYIDTNYEGKADAAIAASRDHDFVFVHVEAVDEVSHARDLPLKIRAIEDFDRRLVQRVIAALGDNARYAVLPDHPVPVSTGKHTRAPVPFSICGPGFASDAIQTFDEISAPLGAFGALRGAQFMDLLFK